MEAGSSLNEVVRTPNIDRVAKRGVIFRNAFVPAPSCTPCRSALLSGQYFWRTGRGAILNGAVWDPSIPSWPLLLKDAGYHIGKTGKVWSPGTPADAPYGGQKFAYESAGRQFNNFGENVTKLMAAGKPAEAAKAEVLAEVRKNFAAFLAAGTADSPWCYWFASTTVHRTWEKGSGKAIWGIDPDSLKGRLPKHLPDVPEVREDVADGLGEAQAWDAGVGEVLQQLEDSGQIENTIIVVSGDHGMPGVPGGKCNLYDFGTQVALLAAGPGIAPGRVVDDFVNLMDLAPTFLEAAGTTPPAVMTGRSLLPLLRSGKQGQVEPQRSYVVTGRERHVAEAREGRLPYPQRAVRTADWLYVRNFAPDRWPMGGPGQVTATSAPAPDVLEQNTRAAFADMDASPTKAWLIAQRNAPEWKWHFDYAFALRPGEELYDLKSDPAQLKNVAADLANAAVKAKLGEQLMAVLRETGDPRANGADCVFERPPFTEAK